MKDPGRAGLFSDPSKLFDSETCPGCGRPDQLAATLPAAPGSRYLKAFLPLFFTS